MRCHTWEPTGFHLYSARAGPDSTLAATKRWRDRPAPISKERVDRLGEEQQHLEKAQRNLKVGLGYEPSALTREMAEAVLRAFESVPSEKNPTQ